MGVRADRPGTFGSSVARASALHLRDPDTRTAPQDVRTAQQTQGGRHRKSRFARYRSSTARAQVWPLPYAPIVSIAEDLARSEQEDISKAVHDHCADPSTTISITSCLCLSTRSTSCGIWRRLTASSISM